MSCVADSQHKQDELCFPLHLVESYEPMSIYRAFLKKKVFGKKLYLIKKSHKNISSLLTTALFSEHHYE